MTEASDDPIASEPRVLLFRMMFGFLLQQQYFGAAATMVAENLSQLHRIERAESSGNLSPESVRAAATDWQWEFQAFKYWYGADDDTVIARLLRELAEKGMQPFVVDLAIELQFRQAGGSDPDDRGTGSAS